VLVSLATRSISDALRSWALLLQCPVGYLEHQRVESLERHDPDGRVLLTFVRGAVGLVSLPSGDARDYDLEAGELQELISLTRAEPPAGSIMHMRETTLVVEDEPAALAVVDEGTLAPECRAVAALVYDPVPSVLDMLKHEVTPADWDRGGGAHESPHRVGVLSGGVLVALASVGRPLGRLARIRVVVAPGYRRRGLGQVVLRALARHVLDQGLLPYCRLAMNDLASKALASAVGFVAFARSLSIRTVAIGSGGGVLGDRSPQLK